MGTYIDAIENEYLERHNLSVVDYIDLRNRRISIKEYTNEKSGKKKKSKTNIYEDVTV